MDITAQIEIELPGGICLDGEATLDLTMESDEYPVSATSSRQSSPDFERYSYVDKADVYHVKVRDAWVMDEWNRLQFLGPWGPFGQLEQTVNALAARRIERADGDVDLDYLSNL